MSDGFGRRILASADFWLWALTIAAIVIASLLLWRAGVVLYPTGHALHLDQLDQIGEFLAGAAAPVGVAWVARTFYLQRQ